MSNGTPKERPAAAQHAADEAVALLEAAAGGHDQTLSAMLARGVDLSATDPQHGNTGLHEAAWRGHSRCVRVLARGGASCSARNAAGFCPLHLAAQNGHNQSVREMLLAGADPDLQNNYGDTALHTACRYGHAGATLILLSGRCKVGTVNLNGDTGLHIASAMGRRKLTKILLSAGCDPSLRNAQGETARDIAERKGLVEILDILDNPPPPNLQYHTRNEEKSKKKKEKKHFANDNLKGYHLASERRKLRNVQFDVTNKKWSPYGCHYFPDPNSFPKPKLETVPKEPLAKGEQYFLDLAGNICKGPVGVGHTCYCAPFFKHLEDRISSNRKSLKRYINRRTERLDNRVSQLAQKADGRINELSRSVMAERAKCTERHLHLEQWLIRGRHRASAAISRKPPITASSTLTRSKSLELLDRVQTTVEIHADNNGRTINDQLSRSVDILDTTDATDINSGTDQQKPKTPSGRSNASTMSSDIYRIEVKSQASNEDIKQDLSHTYQPTTDNFNSSFLSQATTVIRKDLIHNSSTEKDEEDASAKIEEKKRKPILKNFYNLSKQKIAKAVESKHASNHIDLSRSQAELSTLKKELFCRNSVQSNWKNNILSKSGILKSSPDDKIVGISDLKYKNGSLSNLKIGHPLSVVTKPGITDYTKTNLRINNSLGLSCPTRINLFSRAVTPMNMNPLKLNTDIISPGKLSVPPRLNSPNRIASPSRLSIPSRLSSPSRVSSPSVVSEHTTISAPEIKVSTHIAQIEKNIQNLIQNPSSHLYHSQPIFIPDGDKPKLNKPNSDRENFEYNDGRHTPCITADGSTNIANGVQTYENITPAASGSSNLYVKPITSPSKSAHIIDSKSLIPKDAYFHEMPNKRRNFMETHFSYNNPEPVPPRKTEVYHPVQLHHPLVNIQNAQIQKTNSRSQYNPTNPSINARSRHPLYNSNIDLNSNDASLEYLPQPRNFERVISTENMQNHSGYQQNLPPSSHTMSLSNLDLEISHLQSQMDRRFTIGSVAARASTNGVYQNSHDFQLNSPLDRIIDLNHSPLDSHNDSGYSTKIYGSSQGPSPSLSGQFEYEGNKLTNMINGGIKMQNPPCNQRYESDCEKSGSTFSNLNGRPQINGPIPSTSTESDLKIRNRLLNKLHNAMKPQSTNISASSLV